jgi:hypothetical protein
MGRGRQKAKQQKIARKLKYLTTDTNYDELAKELRVQEPSSDSIDPFADAETTYSDDSTPARGDARVDAVDGKPEAELPVDDDLDEYAKWAAEAAAKATSGEMPVTPAAKAQPKPHRIPMPVPSALSKNGALHRPGASRKTGVPHKVAGGAEPHDAGAGAADESGKASKTSEAKAANTGSVGKMSKTAKASKAAGGTAPKPDGKSTKAAKPSGASTSRSNAAPKTK